MGLFRTSFLALERRAEEQAFGNPSSTFVLTHGALSE